LKLGAFLRGIPHVGWAVVFTGFSWGVFGAILGVVSPELREELGNYQDLGLLMAVWAGGSVVGAFQGGRMAHRFAPRPLVLVYLGLTSVALLLLVTARSFWPLAAGFFLIAVFEAALFTLGHGVLANVYTDPQLRARSLGLVDVAYSMGHLVAPSLIIGLHVFNDEWRLPYQAFFVLVGISFMAFWSRRAFVKAAHVFHVAGQDPNVADTRSDSSGSTRAVSVAPQGYLHLLRQPAVRWVMGSGLLAAILEWGPIFWAVSYGLEVQGLSANQARVGLQFFVGGMVAARLWQSFLHSQITLATKLGRLSVVTALGCLLVVTSPLWMPRALAPWGFWLLNLVYGAGVGAFFPVLLAWLIDRYPHTAPKISALQVISFTVGCQIAGFAIGSLGDRLGLHAAYATLALVALGLVAGVRQIKRMSA
jgi:MFS family permease